ncbi:UDP-N-acetylmuramoyl-L-alanine--D-glutamate ligase [bacterium]|nr:UDP-N-acetylmuramoyl-L-alanine--D-glutamate ligase [bacterium]
MNDWLGQKVGIYGLGKTGRACVEYLAPRMVRPLVIVDNTTADDLARLQAEAEDRYDLLAGDDALQQATELDTLIVSPGVPLTNENVSAALAAGVNVISELEFASRYCEGYLIGITGTNGKSTTTVMLGHILSALGPCHVLGNIGSPLLASLDEIQPNEFVALEVSSYQLEAIDAFAPRIAIYTNLTPDHLDRHGTVEEYARIKRRMVDNMQEGDFVITNAMTPEFHPDVFNRPDLHFLQYRSTPGNRLRGAWLANDRIICDLGSEGAEIPLDCIQIPGLHNVENAMAAILACLSVGATAETIIERLSSFHGYEHRIELCREAGGIRFYNDSKATNPEATIIALRAMEGPLAIILGGRDKNTDLSAMVELLKQKAQHAIVYGEAADRFEQELRAAGYNGISRVDNVEQAVREGVRQLAGEGGTLLLSPACASFDQYPGFDVRGEHFKQIVASLELG